MLSTTPKATKMTTAGYWCDISGGDTVESFRISRWSRLETLCRAPNPDFSEGRWWLPPVELRLQVLPSLPNAS
jgi:hypothetical protein